MVVPSFFEKATRWAQIVFKNHVSDFKNCKEKGTEISKYIWKLKNYNIDYKIDWEVIHHIGKAKNLQSICSTCILETVAIAKADRRDNLNKRYELFYSCPHFRKQTPLQNLSCP